MPDYRPPQQPSPAGPDHQRSRGERGYVLAAVISGVCVLAAAGIGAYAQFASGSGPHRPALSTQTPSATTAAPVTAPASTSAPASTPVTAPSTDPSAAPPGWTYLVTEPMESDGGIDMDSWPYEAGTMPDVDPVLDSDGTAITWLRAANGAVLVRVGLQNPTPDGCAQVLKAADGSPSPLVSEEYYCVRTSEQKLILFQVTAVNGLEVTLSGFAPDSV